MIGLSIANQKMSSHLGAFFLGVRLKMTERVGVFQLFCPSLSQYFPAVPA